jgi:hypothetical protein
LSTAAPEIEVESIAKRFCDFMAVNGISFAARSG